MKTELEKDLICFAVYLNGCIHGVDQTIARIGDPAHRLESVKESLLQIQKVFNRRFKEVLSESVTSGR